jgi:hypothetical protein
VRAHGPSPVRGRLHGAFFAALCLAGAAASVGLTVHEATRTPSLVATVAHDSRVGRTTTVTVVVRNTTGEDRCASIRVAARDRAGHDLAAVTVARSLDLPAHARRSVLARLTLTPRQYAEQLAAFYPSQRACVR